MLVDKIRSFKNDERGVASVELMLSVPILVWALLSTYVYFQAFRAESISTRAGLTIADMYSREATVDDAFVKGSFELLKTLSAAAMTGTPSLRVTSFSFNNNNNKDSSDDTVKFIWSEVRGDAYIAHTNATLNAFIENIPIMDNGQKAILVETASNYSAPFSIGIGPFIPTDLDDVKFNTFTVIRPRFAVKICYEYEDNSVACD